ncbi:MAG: SIS domain-containing protein [Pseudomonadota bacterium]
MSAPKEDFTAVAAQIRMNMPSLTGTEAKVASTLTNFKPLEESTRIREVAQTAGVSEALVVKVAKKLGFDGFKEIKAALIGYRNGTSAGLYDEISPEDDLETVASKVFRTSIQALEETRAILDVEKIERTARILSRADRVDIYGVGGSAQIARDVAHKFLRIGRRIAVHDDPHMMMMSASVLDATDAVIAISHSGNSEAVIAR